MFAKKNIPSKKDNLSMWYQRVILESGMADYGPVKGTMIFKPYGYKIWELLQQNLDPKIKQSGVDNAYFPLFIPESLINKEKAHIKGFSPELAVVTQAGGEELTEKVVIRPTSETVIYESFSKWISSWRDLPMKLNQWCNVVRWEKRTYLFLRTSEFLWQEGHTAHSSHNEAKETVDWAINTYKDVYENVFALSGYVGEKSESEKFAGAKQTMTIETIMPDGKAVQAATSHDLGQNFAKTFDINYQDKKGKKQFVWQTSWGISTRSIGAMVLAHGDDNGLCLPPNLAPIQVIILSVKPDNELISYGNKIKDILEKSGIRVKLDDAEDESMGYKINKWELKGVPIRIEIGPNELKAKNITSATRNSNQKISISFDNITKDINQLLEQIQQKMLAKSKKFLKENTHKAKSYDEFKNIMSSSKGFILADWCENEQCEQKIKNETKATTRLKASGSILSNNNKCICCDCDARSSWYFAQAY